MEIKIDPRVLEEVQNYPYRLLFMTISGAHLYGFASPDSDYDLRGCHLLALSEVVGLSKVQETKELMFFRPDGLEVDLVTHDAQKYFNLLLKKNGYVLEQIFSPWVAHTTPAHAELKEIARACITRHHNHHYRGFASTEWRLLSKENPPKVKPLLYIFRVLLTGIWMMRTGEVEANLVKLNQEFNLPYLPELIEMKMSGAEKGVLPDSDLTFYETEYTRLLTELDEAALKSSLPERPSLESYDLLNDLLVRLRLNGL